MLTPRPLGGGGGPARGGGRPGFGSAGGNVRQEVYQQRMGLATSTDRDLANLDAAQALKAMMNSGVRLDCVCCVLRLTVIENY